MAANEKNVEKKVLFQYNNSRWPVVLQSGDNIVQKVRDHYNLNSDEFGNIIFQKYFETWDKWVDIKQDEICDRDKINILLGNPSIPTPQKNVKTCDSNSITVQNQDRAKGILSQPANSGQQTTLQIKDGKVAIGPVLEVDATTNDATVVVELSVDEIRKRSTIFNNSSKSYHNKMNDASFELCLHNPELCNNKQQLIEMCREKLDKEGYSYKKKRSRSKVFGSESSETRSEPKKIKMSADIRAKRIKELTADITSLEDRTKLLQKQRVKAVFESISNGRRNCKDPFREKKKRRRALSDKKKNKQKHHGTKKRSLHCLPLLLMRELKVVHCLLFGPRKAKTDMSMKIT